MSGRFQSWADSAEIIAWGAENILSQTNPALTNEQVLFMAYSLRRLQEKSPSLYDSFPFFL